MREGVLLRCFCIFDDDNSFDPWFHNVKNHVGSERREYGLLLNLSRDEQNASFVKSSHNI